MSTKTSGESSEYRQQLLELTEIALHLNEFDLAKDFAGKARREKLRIESGDYSKARERVNKFIGFHE